MFPKWLGTSTSPVVIESKIEDSSVKVVKCGKFRSAGSNQLCIQRLLSMKTFTLQQRILFENMTPIDQGLCDIKVSPA